MASLTPAQATGPQLAAAYALATLQRKAPARITEIVLDADGHVSAVGLGVDPEDGMAVYVLNFAL